MQVNFYVDKTQLNKKFVKYFTQARWDNLTYANFGKFNMIQINVACKLKVLKLSTNAIGNF